MMKERKSQHKYGMKTAAGFFRKAAASAVTAGCLLGLLCSDVRADVWHYSAGDILGKKFESEEQDTGTFDAADLTHTGGTQKKNADLKETGKSEEDTGLKETGKSEEDADLKETGKSEEDADLKETGNPEEDGSRKKEESAADTGDSAANTYNPFEGVTVSFEGTDGSGTAQVVPGHYQGVFEYALSQTRDLSNGDTVVLTYSFSEEMAEAAENHLMTNAMIFETPSVTSETLTVSGLTDYASKASDLSEDTMKVMQDQAGKAVQDSGAVKEGSSPAYCGLYFLTPVSCDSDEEGRNGEGNQVVLVYRVTDSSGNEKYVPVVFHDITLNEDGSNTVNLQDWSGMPEAGSLRSYDDAGRLYEDIAVAGADEWHTECAGWQSDETAEVYKLYSRKNNTYTYTADLTERREKVGLGWVDQGTAWTVPSLSDVPVLELKNEETESCLFTTDPAYYKERADADGWSGCGVAFYADPDRTVAVHTMTKEEPAEKNQADGEADSFITCYTTDQSEAANLKRSGWTEDTSAADSQAGSSEKAGTAEKEKTDGDNGTAAEESANAGDFGVLDAGNPGDVLAYTDIIYPTQNGITDQYVRTDADGITENDIVLMTAMVVREFGAGSHTAKVAVAAALMNEIERKDGGFENMNTIAQVLAPDSIFPGVGPADIARANAFPRDMYADCRAAVIDALEGADPTNGAVCFCTVDFWNSIGGVSYAKWSMEIEGVKFYGW